MEQASRLDRGDGVELAWARQEGRGPTVVFLPGFRSDMTGDKATALAAFCAERGQAMLRFDYSGHGASGGRFEDGTIGRWTDDALAVIDRLTEGPLVLVGSSMGGWIALLAALARPDRVAGADRHRRRARLHRGADVAGDDASSSAPPSCATACCHVPSQYGEPYPHHPRADRGRPHPSAAECADRARLPGAAAARPGRSRRALGDWRCGSPSRSPAGTFRSSLVKDGDHRLSRPQDLALLRRTLAAAPRPGWRVAPRGSSDSASAGQAPACVSPARHLAVLRPEAARHRRSSRASARSNGTGSGAATPSSRAASCHHVGTLRRLVVHQIEHACATARGPAASPPSPHARCRRGGCGRTRGPAC